jgi:hypothetical protein
VISVLHHNLRIKKICIIYQRYNLIAANANCTHITLFYYTPNGKWIHLKPLNDVCNNEDATVKKALLFLVFLNATSTYAGDETMEFCLVNQKWGDVRDCFRSLEQCESMKAKSETGKYICVAKPKKS